MISESVVKSCVKELIQVTSKDQVLLDPATLKQRSHDVSYHTPHLPFAVIMAYTEEDISKILKTCNKYKVPVIPVAGASSLEGHIIPLAERGAIIIDLSEMDKVIAVHEKDLDVVVQPGVGWMDLRSQLEPLGLFFPPDPGAAACFGGMCGTNCSGTLAWRYGTMKDSVLSLRVVLADGTIIKTRQRATKSSAGYDLTRLIVGSEGTLGVISEITLRLRRIPKHSTVIFAQFPTLEDAANAVAEVVHQGLILNRMELMDTYTIKSINLNHPESPYPEKTAILFECAGSSPEVVNELVASVDQITRQAHRTLFRFAKNAEEAEELWNIRKRAYFSAKALRPQVPNTQILTTDVAVPISQLCSAITQARRDLDELGVVSSIVAHAGDGNFHCLLTIDPKNPEDLRKAQLFRDKNARAALKMGGTCTGEHGIGTGKIHLLEEEVGLDTVQLMRNLKKMMDPNGILNPGKVFTEIPKSKI